MTRAITRTETHATRTTAPLVLSRITTSSTPPGLTGDRWTRGKTAVSAMTRDRPKKRRLLLARETTTPSARARIKQGPVVQSHGAFLADRARDRVTTTSALWPRAQLGWEVSHDTETHAVFAFAAILALSVAAPAIAAQPNQSCEDQPMTPGNSSSAPGSAFNPAGVAGTHFAVEQPQNSNNPMSVSQYDVACFRVSR